MKAYKYRSGNCSYDEKGNSLFYRDVETLVKNQIYAPTVSELNDPNENNVDDKILLDFMYSRSNDVYSDWIELKEKLSKMGIYSLSSSHDNELLWSYYSSGHKGFVIEYDLDYFISSFTYSDLETMCYFIDVKYLTELPKIRSPRHLRKLVNPEYANSSCIKLYLGNKSTNWKHEEESRLILEKSGFIEYDYRAVTAIYFGFRMNNQEIEFVMNKLKGRRINYYQMKLSTHYNLEAYTIGDKFWNSKEYVLPSISYNNLLLSKELLRENYSYRKLVKEAIEIVCSMPLVEEVIGVGIKTQPTLIIDILVISTGIYPLKFFPFLLDKNNKLHLIDDVSKEKEDLNAEMKDIKYNFIKTNTAADSLLK